MLREFQRDGRPLYLAVRPDDLDWLLGLVRAGEIRVDWINHSYHHRFDPRLPLGENFLLEKGTDLAAEILRTEQAMIARGLVPSVFFRFPGLVSDPTLFGRITAFGLIPVGSDAWLAKGQAARSGSIVLVHGNGNEPLGVKDFLELLAREKADIKKGQWLLFDLRDGLAREEKEERRSSTRKTCCPPSLSPRPAAGSGCRQPERRAPC